MSRPDAAGPAPFARGPRYAAGTRVGPTEGTPASWRPRRPRPQRRRRRPHRERQPAAHVRRTLRRQERTDAHAGPRSARGPRSPSYAPRGAGRRSGGPPRAPPSRTADAPAAQPARPRTRAPEAPKTAPEPRHPRGATFGPAGPRRRPDVGAARPPLPGSRRDPRPRTLPARAPVGPAEHRAREPRARMAGRVNPPPRVPRGPTVAAAPETQDPRDDESTSSRPRGHENPAPAASHVRHSPAPKGPPIMGLTISHAASDFDTDDGTPTWTHWTYGNAAWIWGSVEAYVHPVRANPLPCFWSEIHGLRAHWSPRQTARIATLLREVLRRMTEAHARYDLPEWAPLSDRRRRAHRTGAASRHPLWNLHHRRRGRGRSDRQLARPPPAGPTPGAGRKPCPRENRARPAAIGRSCCGYATSAPWQEGHELDRNGRRREGQPFGLIRTRGNPPGWMRLEPAQSKDRGRVTASRVGSHRRDGAPSAGSRVTPASRSLPLARHGSQGCTRKATPRQLLTR